MLAFSPFIAASGGVGFIPPFSVCLSLSDADACHDKFFHMLVFVHCRQTQSIVCCFDESLCSMPQQGSRKASRPICLLRVIFIINFLVWNIKGDLLISTANAKFRGCLYWWHYVVLCYIRVSIWCRWLKFNVTILREIIGLLSGC